MSDLETWKHLTETLLYGTEFAIVFVSPSMNPRFMTGRARLDAVRVTDEALEIDFEDLEDPGVFYRIKGFSNFAVSTGDMAIHMERETELGTIRYSLRPARTKNPAPMPWILADRKLRGQL